MIGTQRKIDAGRGIDSFRSREPMERSGDKETAGDARHRRKVTQENTGERRVTWDAGVMRQRRRMQGKTQGRRSVDAG